MALFFLADPDITPSLRAGLLRTWTDSSNAGGAVGFVPPVTEDDVEPSLDTVLASVGRGRTRLVVGLDGDEVRAAGFLERNTHRLMQHWVWAKTVMVHPESQGHGAGFALMLSLAGVARSMPGIEAIRLACRGGLGLEDFYARCGYKEVGRVPGAIRVGVDDDRDDITMLLAL
ncbi:GNAT family N-acetyltransferase [Mumia sp. zg.B21]|uniref:GNAT family N-acetyltransferase n=1 Tax=Mumia sp. zg.B21 TaxID=2855447 RepID=UPI001C6EE078|nr:GNAT family N-acetyltransferase [Mumia sp. zg.B21]MBW9209404.1 GNAT family N-acetyltransferase [Mumia sp. zg.B21]